MLRDKIFYDVGVINVNRNYLIMEKSNVSHNFFFNLQCPTSKDHKEKNYVCI